MTKSKIFALGISITFLAAIIYGFILLGSPSTQRAMRLDQQRVSNLQNISYAVDSYWDRNGTLPQSLNDLQGTGYWVESVTDPATSQPYEYRILSEKEYELCAVFQSRSEEQQSEYPRAFSERIWDHQEGRQCFQIEAQKLTQVKGI